MIEAVEQYAQERNLSIRDATQTFLQVIVLKNLSLPNLHLMGGTALVLGHGNPRFSEDIDLTQVKNPLDLKSNLTKAATELEGWLGSRVGLIPPKKGARTWRLSWARNPSETLQLHVDCQAYRAQTTHPIILNFPSIPSFVFEAEGLEEIMADKMIALAYRRYLGGRDLFDLWFHWLRPGISAPVPDKILDLLHNKLKERSLTARGLADQLKQRLSPSASLARAKDEWQRYLPASFQKESVYHDILQSSRRLLELLP